eukprot:SAG11_NODE_2063_length_3870_cov_4.378679_3_plen_128_part_00
MTRRQTGGGGDEGRGAEGAARSGVEGRGAEGSAFSTTAVALRAVQSGQHGGDEYSQELRAEALRLVARKAGTARSEQHGQRAGQGQQRTGCKRFSLVGTSGPPHMKSGLHWHRSRRSQPRHASSAHS